MNIQRIVVIFMVIAGYMPQALSMQNKTYLHSLVSKFHNPKTNPQRFKRLLKEARPLAITAMENDAEKMDAILKSALAKDIDHQDAFGETALHYAAINGCADTVNALLQAKATVDLVDKQGNTPLLTSVLCKHAHIAELLIKAKANINHASPSGKPLTLAVMKDSPECVALLIRLGAVGIEEALEATKKIQEKVVLKNGNQIIEMLKSALSTKVEPKQEAKAAVVAAQPAQPLPGVVLRTMNRLTRQANVIEDAYRHRLYVNDVIQRVCKFGQSKDFRVPTKFVKI